MKGQGAATLAVTDETADPAEGAVYERARSANGRKAFQEPRRLNTGGNEYFSVEKPIHAAIKRAIDIARAIALIIFFAPLMLAVYFAVRLDGGPGVYVHERIGKNGVRFQCYKFRSMIPDAERVLKDLLVCNEQFRRDWNADQKLRNDPRITRIGVFLRKKSLDELPQLFNVLKGDMSLVGPRPITVEEIERYGSEISFYLKTRPGLTGSWQVSGRNDVSYEERVALDVAYTKNWTYFTDFMILLKTVRVVLSGRGAL